MSDRFISPCPPPEPWETERLSLLAEECAEVTQRAMKAIRFGMQEIQPGQPLTNLQRLTQEVGDLMAVIDLLVDEAVLDEAALDAAMTAKRAKLAKFMQHQPPEFPQ